MIRDGNIIQKLQDFIDYLSDIKTFDVEERKTCKEVLDLPLHSLERKSKIIFEHRKIKIPNDFLYVFNISNLSVCWSCTNDDNDFIYGGFVFNGLSEALAQDSDFWDVYNSLNMHESYAEELDFLNKLN